MTETAWYHLVLIIRSTRIHVAVLGLNSSMSSRSFPPKDVKLVRQFSDNNYCYFLPVIITFCSIFAPLRP